MASCAIHLKSKVYVIICPGYKIIRRFCRYDQLFVQKEGIEISGKTDYLKIAKEIAEYDFHGYASLVLLVVTDSIKPLNVLYDAIKRNSTLKHVLKFVLIDGLGLLSYLMRSDYFNFPLDSMKTMISSINNLIILTVVDYKVEPMRITDLKAFLGDIFSLCEEKSIQELANNMVKHNETISDAFYNLETTCNAGGYIYNINPAIAIFINHLSFPNENIQLDFRKGSLKDIEALQQSFRSKKISYLTINDGSLEDVQAIMQKVQAIKFRGIKDLYIVIMSHGDEGDIIYTKTESYSIRNEIVLPLLKNSTLANVQKYIIVNACRGSLDPRFEDPYDVERDLQKFHCFSNTVLYPDDEKLMLIFSTQKGCVSFRFNDKGSIFVQIFCKHFGVDFDEKSMEVICQETKKQMKFEICDDQVPDFQMSGKQSHTIKMELANFCQNQDILNDIFEFYRTHFKEYITDDGNNAEINCDVNISHIRKYDEEG